MNEFDYAKNIDTSDKFAEFILTKDYWADTWAISTLERLLNTKKLYCYLKRHLIQVTLVLVEMRTIER